MKKKHISSIFTAINSEYLVLINWNLPTRIEGKLDSIVQGNDLETIVMQPSLSKL